MATLPKVDVVFVGFGMVGGIIANELSKRATNLKMVGLERGPFRDTYPDFVVDHHDEWKYAVQGQLFQDYAQETTTFRNDGKQTALPIRQLGNFLPGNGVGGAMVHWNGQTWRFLPDFFVYRSHLEARYGKGFLPADTTIQDWGVTYDELEPYYTQFDKTMGISGKAGNLKGQIQEGGNPFEGPRSEEYPAEALSGRLRGGALRRRGQADGLQALPGAVREQPGGVHEPGRHDPRRVQLLRPLRAVRLPRRREGEPDRHRHPERPEERPGRDPPLLQRLPHQPHRRPGDERLVLRPERHRAGAARRPDRRRLVHAQQHPPHADVQDRPAVRPAGEHGRRRAQLHAPAGRRGRVGVVRRPDAEPLHGQRRERRRHGRVQLPTTSTTRTSASSAAATSRRRSAGRGRSRAPALPPGSPAWGSGWKAAAKRYYDTFISVGMQAEHAAYRQNYVDLDPTYRDAYGNPLLRITLDWTDNERKMVNWVNENVMTKIIAQLNPAIQQVNGPITNYSSVPYQSTHINGGTVMGGGPGDERGEQVLPGLGDAEPVRDRGEQLPAERGLQPDRDGGGARLPHGGRDRHQIPQEPRHDRLSHVHSG